MADPSTEDLLSLSRDVGRACAALARWRSALASDPAQHADDDPLEAVRRVAGKSTWDALGSQQPSAADVPLRDALRRWVFALTQARVGRASEARTMTAASEPRGLYAGDAPRLVSWREAWLGVVTARTPSEAALWLEAAAGSAPPLAEALREWAARRVEVARRLGVGHPWEGIAGVGPGPLRDGALRLLAATDELSRAVRRESLREASGAAAVIHDAAAREAGEGWPSQLNARWLEGAFGGLAAGLRLELPRLPRVVGAASFMRALYAFGYAVRVAAAPAAMPFALARSPAFVGAHRLAFTSAALAADPAWQSRVLGVGRRAAAAQARVLARTALLDARLHAARILLGDDADPAARDRFEEVGARLFGAELDARLTGAWPAARHDEPARWLALVQAPSFAGELRDRFDADWYRNPRAWAHLRSSAAAMAEEPVDVDAMPARVDEVARAFEGALG